MTEANSQAPTGRTRWKAVCRDFRHTDKADIEVWVEACQGLNYSGFPNSSGRYRTAGNYPGFPGSSIGMQP